MARFDFARRKRCRFLSVRTVLVGVPSVWAVIIWWTLYNTQSLQQHQSRQQIPLSAGGENHAEEHSRGNRQGEESIIKQSGIEETDAHESYGIIQKVLKPPDHISDDTNHDVEGPDGVPADDDVDLVDNENQYEGVDAENKKREGDGVDSGHKNKDSKFLKLWSVNDSENHKGQLQEDNQHRSNVLNATPADHVEFLWNPEKPHPGKKVITPGPRVDPPKLGENGIGVKIKPENLNRTERQKYDDGWQNHQFNEYVSLQISIQRATPDYRLQGCKQEHQISHLPQASIIICFYNEAWSVLQRTIDSVFSRSPPELIAEVILVDDHSGAIMMHEPLEYYVAQVDKLRLLRMRRRSGLVRARLAGVQEAKGSVIVFLDSHVECEEGWLVPLMETIHENPKVAVTPEIDVIDHNDFSIQAAYNNIGILKFRSFTFDWTTVLPRLQKGRKSSSDPIQSPTMAGGLFAIRKDYFVALGTYDTGLELWGGENIELSLKLWMCGGGILIHPCSRVAHIFREKSPYLKGKSANVLVKNSARVAEVWADEYRKLFFLDGSYNEYKYGSVHERVELRKKLQCHNFSWYHSNVYPEMYIERSGQYFGEIESATGKCIHQAEASSSSLLMLTDCRKAIKWESTMLKEIRHAKTCMGRNTAIPLLIAGKCDLESKSQVFEYQPAGSIFHPLTNSCLTASYNNTQITLQPCRGRVLQTWKWPENKQFILPRE